MNALTNDVTEPTSIVRAIQQNWRTSLRNNAIVSAFLAGVAIAIQSIHLFKDMAHDGLPMQHSCRGLLSLGVLCYTWLLLSFHAVLLEYPRPLPPLRIGYNRVPRTMGTIGSAPRDVLPLLVAGSVRRWRLRYRYFCFIFSAFSVSTQILLYVHLQEPKETRVAFILLGAFHLLPALAFSLTHFTISSYDIGTPVVIVSSRAMSPIPSLTPTRGPIPSDGPRLFALLVGINVYAAPEINNLKGAIADARAFERYLRGKLQVQDTIQILLNQEASRDNIIQGFLNLGDNPDIRKGDTILIYYAGHGSLIPAPDNWPSGRPDGKIQSIIPHDFCRAEGEQRVDVIPDFMIGGLIHEISQRHGTNITAIFDCCHSASGTR